MTPGSSLTMLCSLSQCHCLRFINFSCTRFIYFLRYRILKDKTNKGSRFFVEVGAVEKGRVPNGTL